MCLFVALLFETRIDADLAVFVRDALVTGTFVFAFSSRFGQFLVHSNCVLWSLGVEFWFSVAFPLLYFGFKRVGAVWVTVASLVIAFVVRFHMASAWQFRPIFLMPIMDGPFGRMDDFVAGMAICRLYVRKPITSGVGAVVVLFGGILCFTVGAVAWDNVLSARIPFVVSAWLNDVVLLGLASIVLGLLGSMPRVIHGALASAPLQLCGMMCYSLYSWHLLGMHPFDEPALSLQFSVVRLGLTFAVSALTYRWIEFPTKPGRELFLTFAK